MENGQCKSCGCDYFQAKGKNIRYALEYIAAVIGILLMFFMFGSCLGCEACFECAAACDSNCGTDLEECGRDCDDETDGWFQCEGITCGDKQGCFSCHGKWDCSTCSGTTVYTIKLVLGENDLRVDEIPKEDMQFISSFPVLYPDNMSSTYYEFKGYFSKKSGGTPYVDAQGNLIKSITKSVTLYAQYKEKNEGETYSLQFNTEKPDGTGNYFATPTPLEVVVGGPVLGMPDAPDLEGLNFLGWYTGNGVLAARQGEDWDFHLSTFEHLPNDPRFVMLYARYEVQTFDIRFHYDGGTTETETVEYGTYLNSVWNRFDMSQGNSLYYFDGWALEPNASLGEGINGDFEIMNDIDLYEIRRDYVTFTFDTGREQFEITLQEGNTYSYSELTMPSGGGNLNEYVKMLGYNPGYEFTGWSIGSTTGVALPTLEVKTNMSTTIMAKWKWATYSITYYVSGDDYTTDANSDRATTSYHYGDTSMLWDYSTRSNRFVGWYLESDPGNVFTSLPSGLYGDIILHAKFS